jgi:uncharacterized protein YbjT (DUF2867 family)
MSSSTSRKETDAAMKVTIVGATGGIGKLLLEQGLDAGHEVTAVVRSASKLARSGVRVVATDLATPDAGALAAAFAGADAVLSTLGPTSSAEVGIAERGTRAIVDAMDSVGARRLLVVSAAPIGTVPSPARPHPPRYDPGDGFFMRHLLSPFIKAILRRHYADLARMEEVVASSSLDWTIVRPPRLTQGALTTKVRVAYGQNVRGGTSIARADVACFMLSAMRQDATIRKIVAIAAG